MQNKNVRKRYLYEKIIIHIVNRKFFSWEFNEIWENIYFYLNKIVNDNCGYILIQLGRDNPICLKLCVDENLDKSHLIKYINNRMFQISNDLKSNIKKRVGRRISIKWGLVLMGAA